MTSIYWGDILCQQFGAAIEMLGNVVVACPEALWRSSVWDDPADAPAYTEFWFVSYHTLRMRHVQDHAAQLSLHLGRHGAAADLDWVSQPSDRAG